MTGYRVLLRNNQTGEERWFQDPLPWEDHTEFMWTEGNYACDCNRHLSFERAGGREPADEEGKCGTERYTALYAEFPDGARVPLDK
ncbi:hypothetical protein BH20PSE1_BH20PSE1_01400 [soil metagenome]